MGAIVDPGERLQIRDDVVDVHGFATGDRTDRIMPKPTRERKTNIRLCRARTVPAKASFRE